MTREDLITALEQASGPSRDLDGAIFSARIGVEQQSREVPAYVPLYTGSMDAALTLVPEGCSALGLLFDKDEAEGIYGAEICTKRGAVSGYWGRDGDPFAAHGYALAICIAALRTRQ